MNFFDARKSITIVGCGAVLALAAALPAAAQDDASAEPAPKPIPALMAAHVDKGLMLSVARADGYVVAVGGNGVILRAEIGGNWKQIASPVDTALNQVMFADDKHGWAVGHDAVILHTSDGGQTWKLQNFEPMLFTPLFSVLPLNADSAIAVGAFGLMKRTSDGGAHWSDVEAPAITDDKYHLNAINRLANGTLAVAGEGGLVGFSTDGETWQRANTGYEGSFFGVEPWGEQGAMVFGMRGNVFVTDDVASDKWRRIETSTTSSFFGGEKLADGRVLLTGTEGSVMIVDLDGTVRAVADPKASAREASLTGSLATPEALIVVGTTGVQSLPKL